MPISLAAAIQETIEKPQQLTPFYWLLELEISRGDDVTPAVLFRVCTANAPLEWPLASGDLWYPFPFAFSPFEQNEEGDLPHVELTVDNVKGFLMRYLHAGDGLEGNAAKLFLIPTAALALAWPNDEFLQWDLEIASVVANIDSIGMRLERPNFFVKLSPTDRFIPQRCRWTYGSDQCGYVLNEFAAFPRCGKTYPECVERGQDLIDRGLPPVLPGNYGGHPGVSVRR